MQVELKSHRILFGLLAMWLMIFLVILLFFEAHRYTSRLEAEVILVLSIAVTSALGYIGLAEIIVGFQFGRVHRRELVTYLVLGTISLLTGIMLALTTPLRLAFIAIAVAPHAILFGLLQLRLSRGLTRHRSHARSLKVCGVIDILSGIVLACGFFLSDVNVITLLGVTAAITLLQLFPFLLFPRRGPWCLQARRTRAFSKSHESLPRGQVSSKL